MWLLPTGILIFDQNPLVIYLYIYAYLNTQVFMYLCIHGAGKPFLNLKFRSLSLNYKLILLLESQLVFHSRKNWQKFVFQWSSSNCQKLEKNDLYNPCFTFKCIQIRHQQEIESLTLEENVTAMYFLNLGKNAALFDTANSHSTYSVLELIFCTKHF